MRRAHFTVQGARFNGTSNGVMTVEQKDDGSYGTVRCRPHGRHYEAVLPLDEVYLMVLERDAKAAAAAHEPIQKVRRGKL